MLACGLEDRGEAADVGTDLGLDRLGGVLGFFGLFPGPLKPPEDRIGVKPADVLARGAFVVAPIDEVAAHRETSPKLISQDRRSDRDDRQVIRLGLL